MTEPAAAVVRAACIPGRAEPDRRTEMVTQWLSGEALAVEEVGPERWLAVRGPDGYRCWVDAGGLVAAGAEEARAWSDRATVLSLGTDLAPAPGERAGPPPSRWLPWGGRAVPVGNGLLEVAGGARVRPVEPGALVTDRADRFPATPEGLLRTARRWMGVPYLWGGRTRQGVDCSGLAQAVCRAHGLELPRDSDAQRAAVADEGGDAPPPPQGEPGELLFFGPEGGGTDHVAIRAGEGRILHAAPGNGQVVEESLAGDGPVVRELRGRLRAAARPLEEL